MKLRQTGIRHLLLNPRTSYAIDDSLNHTLSNITDSQNLAMVSRFFGDWILYNLGPFELSKTLLPLTNWALDSRYSIGPGNYEVNDTGVFLQLNLGANGDRIAISNYMIPHVDIADYDYLFVNVTGSNNARVLIRFYLENGTPVDLAYWASPSQIAALSFRTLGSGHLRGDAYISLMSGDGQPTYILITEVAILEYIAISKKVPVPFDSWHADLRFTSGPYNFSISEDACFLALISGISGDRLTIASNQFPTINSTEFNFLLADIVGSENALILFRVYLEDGSNFDFAYWVTPSHFQALIHIPSSTAAFRGDAYIGLMSSNGQPCSISIREIALIQTDSIVD